MHLLTSIRHCNSKKIILILLLLTTSMGLPFQKAYASSDYALTLNYEFYHYYLRGMKLFADIAGDTYAERSVHKISPVLTYTTGSKRNKMNYILQYSEIQNMKSVSSTRNFRNQTTWQATDYAFGFILGESRSEKIAPVKAPLSISYSQSASFIYKSSGSGITFSASNAQSENFSNVAMNPKSFANNYQLNWSFLSSRTEAIDIKNKLAFTKKTENTFLMPGYGNSQVSYTSELTANSDILTTSLKYEFSSSEDVKALKNSQILTSMLYLKLYKSKTGPGELSIQNANSFSVDERDEGGKSVGRDQKMSNSINVTTQVPLGKISNIQYVYYVSKDDGAAEMDRGTILSKFSTNNRLQLQLDSSDYFGFSGISFSYFLAKDDNLGLTKFSLSEGTSLSLTPKGYNSNNFTLMGSYSRQRNDNDSSVTSPVSVSENFTGNMSYTLLKQLSFVYSLNRLNAMEKSEVTQQNIDTYKLSWAKTLATFTFSLNYGLKLINKLHLDDIGTREENSSENNYQSALSYTRKSFESGVTYSWTQNTNPQYIDDRNMDFHASYIYKNLGFRYQYSLLKRSEGDRITSLPSGNTNAVSLFYRPPNTSNIIELSYLYSDNSSSSGQIISDSLSAKFSIKVKLNF